MDEELKRKIEALLFSSGNYMSVDELSKLCRVNQEDVRKVISELINDYNSSSSSLMIVAEQERWKLTVKEPFVPVVKKVVTETELTKTIMETLAVIAWKAPVLQSDIIKVRTNKAYDHIKELDEQGFITKKKHGRTYKLELTQKFYNYFDVSSEQEVKKKFERFDKAVEETEEQKAKQILEMLPRAYTTEEKR